MARESHDGHFPSMVSKPRRENASHVIGRSRVANNGARAMPGEVYSRDVKYRVLVTCLAFPPAKNLIPRKSVTCHNVTSAWRSVEVSFAGTPSLIPGPLRSRMRSDAYACIYTTILSQKKPPR